MRFKRRAPKQNCGKKRRFNTQDDAVAHIEYLRSIGEVNGPTNCYRCKECNAFHWGHGKFNVSSRI